MKAVGKAAPPRAWTRRRTWEANHGAFEGHFPSEKILPGVVLLGFLLETLQELDGDVRLRELPQVRWRSPVGPGDAVQLNGTGPSADGTIHFEMRVGKTLVCNGNAMVARC